MLQSLKHVLENKNQDKDVNAESTPTESQKRGFRRFVFKMTYISLILSALYSCHKHLSSKTNLNSTCRGTGKNTSLQRHTLCFHTELPLGLFCHHHIQHLTVFVFFLSLSPFSQEGNICQSVFSHQKICLPSRKVVLSNMENYFQQAQSTHEQGGNTVIRNLLPRHTAAHLQSSAVSCSYCQTPELSSLQSYRSVSCCAVRCNTSSLQILALLRFDHST